MDDAEIGALVRLINGTEAATGRAMEPKLTDPAVKAYAARLVSDHTRLMELMPALPGPRKAPPQAATLRAIFESQSAMLATLPAGPAFDAVFLAVQEVDHATAIDSLLRWGEAASGEELRGAIRQALGAVQAHHGAARGLFQRLSGSWPAPPPDSLARLTAPTPIQPDSPLSVQGTRRDSAVVDTAISDTVPSDRAGRTRGGPTRSRQRAGPDMLLQRHDVSF
jgi:putative membrane protein